MTEELDWNVAVYCLNEEKRLAGCLEGVLAALDGRRAVVSVILNGSRDRSWDIARDFARSAGGRLEIYRISTGDKSNAINQFIYRLRRPARFYGAVDGYAHISAASFRAMEARLIADPHAQAATGICTNGRTMKLATEETLTVGGRLHGQLHAFRRDFFDRMTARGIRLPLGLYVGDGLMASMAAHNLDPLSEAWDNKRVVGVGEATYEIAPLSPFRLEDLQRYWRRKVRQRKGRIQNAAVSEIIYASGFEGLPDSAVDMVDDYLSRHGAPKVAWQDWLFQILAIRENRRSPRLEPQALEAMRPPID